MSQGMTWGIHDHKYPTVPWVLSARWVFHDFWAQVGVASLLCHLIAGHGCEEPCDTDGEVIR